MTFKFKIIQLFWIPLLTLVYYWFYWSWFILEIPDIVNHQSDNVMLNRVASTILGCFFIIRFIYNNENRIWRFLTKEIKFKL